MLTRPRHSRNEESAFKDRFLLRVDTEDRLHNDGVEVEVEEKKDEDAGDYNDSN